MQPLLLLSAVFMIGTLVGFAMALAVAEQLVRQNGDVTYKWGRAWYRVQRRDRH